jgi:hypothetical protein
VAHHHPSPSADRKGRRALAVRNSVLTAVLRRPWRVVARRTLVALRDGPQGWLGVRDAVRRSPRALTKRRTLPPEVEHALRRLECYDK